MFFGGFNLHATLHPDRVTDVKTIIVIHTAGAVDRITFHLINAVLGSLPAVRCMGRSLILCRTNRIDTFLAVATP